MEKMNCSFPWIKSYNGPLQRCGSNDYITDLVNIVREVHSNGTYCNIPNCVNTKWTKATERQHIVYGGTLNFTDLFLNFPSSTKVSKSISMKIFLLLLNSCNFRQWLWKNH